MKLITIGLCLSALVACTLSDNAVDTSIIEDSQGELMFTTIPRLTR